MNFVIKILIEGPVQQFMPVIPTTWEVEIRRIAI
jgi:hypothetical protein